MGAPPAQATPVSLVDAGRLFTLSHTAVGRFIGTGGRRIKYLCEHTLGIRSSALSVSWVPGSLTGRHRVLTSVALSADQTEIIADTVADLKRQFGDWADDE